MSLIGQINKLDDKVQQIEYEKIVTKINECYDELDYIFNELELLVNSIEYFTSNFGKDEKTPFTTFKKENLIEINQDTSKLNNLYADVPSLKIREGIKYNRANVNIKYLKKIYQNHRELLEDPRYFNFKASLFLSTYNLNDKYKEMYDKNKEEIDMIASTTNIHNAIGQLMLSGKIKLDIDEAIDIIEAKTEELVSDEIQVLKQFDDNEYKHLTIRAFFASKTEEFKKRINNYTNSGMSEEEALKVVLPEAYAIVKKAIHYKNNIEIYDTQLMGAVALNDGKITEMYTGEGKTFTAIFPAYLNALTGKEVDVFTPNDYLAKRDSEQNDAIFALLGLTTGCVLSENQSIEEKQKIYKKDIVYGAPSTFAFDYLKDSKNNDKTKLVQRTDKPGFVIVDEADQILINNALSPYVLDESEISSKEDMITNAKVQGLLYNASTFVGNLIKNNDIYVCETYEEYLDKLGYENGNSILVDKDVKEYDKKSILLYKGNDSSNSSFFLTKRGINKLYNFEMKKEIDVLLESTRSYFEEKLDYIEGKDYKINNGVFTFTPRGLEKASTRTDEFYNLKLKFFSEEQYVNLMQYVNNAIKAELLMENGKDYCIAPNEKSGVDEIKVLQDGRIIPDSRYKDGLHEALILKEDLDLQPTGKELNFNKRNTSLSNRALLSRYDKRSGMTGTADKACFNDIYGMQTFTVPKNKEYVYSKNPIETPVPYKREDLPTKLYKNTKEKYVGIVEDIILSHKTGRPLLVVTDDIEEAKILQKLVNENGIKSNLLTANNNLEEEANVIANAGCINAITIATEMAGRGTDIKLGGSLDKQKEKLKISVLNEEALNIIIGLGYANNPNMTPDEKKEYNKNRRKELTNQNGKDSEIFTKKVTELNNKYSDDENYRRKVDDLIERKFEKNKEKISDLGGLKYIQVKPFKTSRNDNQGRGRVGRQCEKGTTIMYSSIDDLRNLRVDETQVEIFNNSFEDKDFLDDKDMGGIIEETIENAQSEIEYQMDLQIASTDTMDLAISSRGLMILNTRKDVVKMNDLTNIVDNLIYDTIIDTIKENVPKFKTKKVDKNNYKLSKLKLDKDNFTNQMNNLFGISIDSNYIDQNCQTVDDLISLSAEIVTKRRKELDNDKNDRKFVMDYLDNVYERFVDGVETVKLQEINDRIAQNGTKNRLSNIDDVYNESIINSKKLVISKMFNSSYKEKSNYDDSFYDMLDELEITNEEKVSITKK